MSKYNNNDNVEYSSLTKAIKDINIQIPDNFEDYVDNVLVKLPKKHKYLYKRLAQIASAFILVLITFSILIYSNEDFAVFAKGIPGLNYLAELITADLGTENALLNNYPVKEPIIIKDGDYTLTIENMIIDEERISFTTTLEGPYFNLEDKEDNNIDGKDANIYDIGNDKSNKYNYVYDVSLDGQEGVVISTSYHDYNKEIININFGEEKENYIRSILNSGEGLKFRCDIRKYKDKSSEVIYSIEDIIVPISEKDVMKTKHIEIDNTLEFEEGIIYIDKMTISPTKMQIIGTETPNNGYTSIGLERVYLLDNNYSAFTNPSFLRFGGGDGYVSYQFIPSIYFDEVNEIIINYESYYYSLPYEPYTFSLNDTFPKTYDYYGHKFTIEEVTVNNGEMTIRHTLDNESEFWLQDINVEGYKSTRSGQIVYDEDGIEKHEFLSYFEGIGDEKEFKFKLGSHKIIVHKPGSIKVPLEFID